MRQCVDSATTVSLNGEDQIVGVTDTGLDMSNCYFYDPDVSALSVKSSDGSKQSSTHRKVVQYYCSTDCMDDATEAHGTHVAGTVAGYATKTKAYGDFVKFNGVAPLAKLAFFDIGKPSGDLAAPGDVNLNLLVKQYNVGARIFSWSWGCKATKISSDCGGAYLSNSEQTDKFLWEYPDSMVFIANGNTGTSPEGVPSTVGAPATAKSCVSVGASMTETNVFKAFASSVLDGVTSDFDINSLAYFSSRGPCHDGRVKPEVTAPGTK
jgi:subtilisin family serine protease